MGAERVYFALCNGRIKIGTSTNVKSRVNSLAGGHPDGMKILCTVDGGYDVEQAFHRKLQAHRVNREWFNDCELVRRAIADFQSHGIASLREFYRPRETTAKPTRATSIGIEEAKSSVTGFDSWDILMGRMNTLGDGVKRTTTKLEILMPIHRKSRAMGDAIATVREAIDFWKKAADHLEELSIFEFGDDPETLDLAEGVCRALLNQGEETLSRVSGFIRSMEPVRT